MLHITEYNKTLLSHPLVPAGPVPTAQDPDGVYPYESFCETARRPILQSYRMIAMENDLIRVVVCPDLGGRIYSLFSQRVRPRNTVRVSRSASGSDIAAS